MVRWSAEERDGDLVGAGVGVEVVMEGHVSGTDVVVPKFESKDGNRRGGNSLLLRCRQLIQVVHH